MIFQHTWRQVLDGSKTQTRRLVKPDESYWEPLKCVVHRHGKTYGCFKWQVGKTYAVQPGRGQKAVGRIRITDIRRERVQDISFDDVQAEGFPIEASFADDPTDVYDACLDALGEYRKVWHRIHTTPGTRWEDNPTVWVLEFELVEADE